jgi:hypothetical protein
MVNAALLSDGLASRPFWRSAQLFMTRLRYEKPRTHFAGKSREFFQNPTSD